MSGWLNSVAGALESLDQAAELTLTTEEERENAQIQLEEERGLALEEAIERDSLKQLGSGEGQDPPVRLTSFKKGISDGVAVPTSAQKRLRSGSTTSEVGYSNSGDAYDSDGRVSTSAAPKEHPYEQRTVAEDLTDDLHAIELALRKERQLRQRDREESAIREELLQKANTDLTKALTTAERTIESMRDAADVATIETMRQNASRGDDDAAISKLQKELERLKRELVKRDVEIDSLAAKSKETETRLQNSTLVADERIKRFESVQRSHREELTACRADNDRSRRQKVRLQQELESYMSKTAMLQERVKLYEQEKAQLGAQTKKRQGNNQGGYDGHFSDDENDLELGHRNSGDIVRRRTKGIAGALHNTPLTKNKRVRSAINQVDRWSLETGAILQRFPLARLIFVVYLVSLHLWVLFLLGHSSHSIVQDSAKLDSNLRGAMPIDPGPIVSGH